MTNVLLFLPFTNFFANLLTKLVKGKRQKESRYFTHLDFHAETSPIAAIEQSSAEIKRMESSVKGMLNDLRLIMAGGNNGKSSGKLPDKLFERENVLDKVQIEITTFLTDVLAGPLSHELAEEARSQLRSADEYESVSDYITNILKLHLRLQEADVKLSEEQQAELLQLHDLIDRYYGSVQTGLETDSTAGYLQKIRKDSRDITGKIRGLRDVHWKRLSSQKVEPLISTSYMDIAVAYRRIKDHLLNIGEANVGGKALAPETSEA